MLTTAMGRLLLATGMDMFQLPIADMLLSATDMSLLAMDMDMLQLPMADIFLSATDMTFLNMDMDMLLPERSIAVTLLLTRGYASLNLSSSTMNWI